MKIKKLTIPGQFRQGDVLITKADAPLPKGKPIEGDILAHGEVTGHHHQVSGATLELLTIPNITAMKMTVTKPKPCTHQEHAPTPLCEPEEFGHKVTRQREYAPNAIRNVAD